MRERRLGSPSVGTLLVLLVLGLPQTSLAQTVQGQLLDRDTGTPVEGALVLLLSPNNQGRGGSLTGSDGGFTLRAPEPGRYILRAFRIGYETVTSKVVGILAGDTIDVILESGTSPIELAELRVEGESRCVLRPGEGLQLARAWEEASKALTVQEWAEGEGLFRFRAFEYQRKMDPKGILVLSESREIVEKVSSNPVRSLPAQELVGQGFIRPAEEGRYDYFGPDAAALLSDAFLDTHCFRFQTEPNSPDLIGLSFEPVRDRRPPDVVGTLWLERETAKPRFLEFEYDWAPWEDAIGIAKGRVEFRELPGGAWIIPRWWIRMPTVALYPPAEKRDPDEFYLIGSLEVGWELAQVTTLDREPVSPVAFGSVKGSVTGEASHDPLPGLQVVLGKRPYATHTDSAGAFFLDALAEGGYSVFPRPLVLDSLGVSLRGSEVFVRGGRTSELEVGLPSRENILGALCGLSPGEPPPAILTGIVRSAETGDPVAETSVLLEWSEKSFWIFKRRVWAQVETDGTGRYRACGFPADTRIKVQAGDRNLRSSVGEFRALSGDIILMDLNVRTLRIGEEQ